MTTIRLSQEIEEELKTIVNAEHRSKSDIIKQALLEYINRNRNAKSSYELGKEYFGQHGSGKTNLSRDYKKLIKEKLNAKFSR